jgi:hypothetical protein
MSSHEIEELQVLIGQLHTKMDLMLRSLKSCQGRCHVDNPPGRWRGLGRALTAFFQPRHELTLENADAEF